MKFLTIEEAKKLSTPRLLAYCKKHMKGNMPYSRDRGSLSEQEKAWEQLRFELKVLLNTREHVEKPCKKK
jgi:hypothetical protein